MNKCIATRLIPIICTLFLWHSMSWANTNLEQDWKMADEIVKTIQLPNIPNRQVSIVEFGAEANKGNALPAIQSAIEKLHQQGGGRVNVPAGLWHVNGPIKLRSKINLHLEDGATLLFSSTAKHFLPVVKTRWEGTEVLSYSPLIYAANVSDVAITGNGIIDGNQQSEFNTWYDKQNNDMQLLRTMGFNAVPVEQRLFGEGHFLRPPLIQFFHAQRVLLEDFNAINSPFWVNHLVYTNHATVSGIKVESHLANNDGVDIDSSSFVLIENNVFRTGDDSVVVKSGRDKDGRNIGIASTDIVIRKNDMGGEDGIGLGSEMSGGIKRVFIEDNILRKGSSAFRFKSNLDRGGLVEFVRVRNCKVESFEYLFWFQLNYPSKLGGDFPATYRDIVFENIEVSEVKNVIEIHAPKSAPLQDVWFKDITIQTAQQPFIIENALNIKLTKLKIADQIWNGQLSSQSDTP